MAASTNNERQIIATEQAPAAIGPYSQAVTIAGVIYTAGQIPVDPATKQIVPGGIREQTAQVMQNLGAILAAGGSSFGQILKTTCFLANLDDFAAFNEVYAQSFPVSPPARSTVQVARLPMGALVEVECIAAVG